MLTHLDLGLDVKGERLVEVLHVTLHGVLYTARGGATHRQVKLQLLLGACRGGRRDITSLSVCQVARATGEAKCHGSKFHKEVTEIKVYWFVCLNTFKIAKVRMDYSRHDIYM